MPEVDEKDRPKLSRPIKLSKWQRIGLTASGAGLLFVGGWAEIASGMDGAGTVAFVAAGALLAALGIVGRAPNRLSGKDYTVEFDDAVQEAVEQIVEDLPREAKEEIVHAEARTPDSAQSGEVVDLLAALQSSVDRARSAKTASNAAARSLEFENHMLSTLGVLLNDRKIRFDTDRDQEAKTRGVDALIRFNGHTLGVDAKARQLMYNDVRERVLSRKDVRDYGDAFMLISETGIAIATSDKWHFIEGYPTRDRLAESLRWLLERLN